MLYKFTKMHGAGNDYIYFNCLENELPDPEKTAVKLSDRHFSVGGDGIIMICKSTVADAKMRMFNADGSEGKMCGNAIRCVAKYLYESNLVKKSTISVETLSGIKYIDLNIMDDTVISAKVNMGKAILSPSLIPMSIDGDTAVNYPIVIGEKDYKMTCVSMGNPHAVIFTDDPDKIDLPLIGPLFEKNDIFPESVNTEFVKVINDHTLKMRVWERGSGETLACGTGACASVVAAVLNGYCNKNTDVKVILRGGELVINYTDKAVFMTGNCITAFNGKVNI